MSCEHGMTCPNSPCSEEPPEDLGATVTEAASGSMGLPAPLASHRVAHDRFSSKPLPFWFASFGTVTFRKGDYYGTRYVCNDYPGPGDIAG